VTGVIPSRIVRTPHVPATFTGTSAKPALHSPPRDRYPLAMTGIGQTLFPHRANGSLIVANGRVVSSDLIGQNFSKPQYFHPRPSAAGSNGYDATASGGSNYDPASQKLIDHIRTSIDQFRRENP